MGDSLNVKGRGKGPDYINLRGKVKGAKVKGTWRGVMRRKAVKGKWTGKGK